MAIQFSVACRTARAAAIETEAGVSPKLAGFTGAVPLNCAAANPAGELFRMTLPADWATQANGALVLAGLWSVAAGAGAASSPVSFRLYKSDGTTCVLQGTCQVGGGDLSINGTVTAGQTVTVTAFTLTEGGA